MIVDTQVVSDPSGKRQSPISGRTALLLCAAALGLGSQIYSGIHNRVEAETVLQQATNQAAVAVVDVASPQVAAATQEVILPGSTQAFTDTPIYARTSGYLKRWYVDIGARVKQHDLLAEKRRLVIRRRWQLFRWQAWVTLQFRFFEFVGPCRLIVAGVRGVRAERLNERDGEELPARRANQDATMGFTPNLDYRPVRAETFWSYYPLFVALFFWWVYVHTSWKSSKLEVQEDNDG